jgi:hypothetical protein
MPEAPLGPKGRELWGLPGPELFLCAVLLPHVSSAAAAAHVTQGDA